MSHVSDYIPSESYHKNQTISSICHMCQTICSESCHMCETISSESCHMYQTISSISTGPLSRDYIQRLCIKMSHVTCIRLYPVSHVTRMRLYLVSHVTYMRLHPVYPQDLCPETISRDYASKDESCHTYE